MTEQAPSPQFPDTSEHVTAKRAVVVESGHVFGPNQRPAGALVQMVDGEGRPLFDSLGRRILCDVGQQTAPPLITAINWLYFIGIMVAISAVAGVVLGVISVIELHDLAHPSLNP